MAQAQFRKIYGKNGSGIFVRSEGIAPSEYLTPDEGLPTLYTDLEDDRFEIVMTKGTILSVVADANNDARVVPANGTGADEVWDDGEATPDTVTVPARSVPIGCAQYDLYRPFDKGTSQGAGWVTRGYVEWPLITGLNDDLAPGDLVASDNIGRPVKISTGDAGTYPWLVVGKVIVVEKFGVNFDDGMLSYMTMTSDPGGLKDVYAITQEGAYKGKLGIRANLDRENVAGAFRVTLNL
jgi:hypothetical protein